MAVGLERAHAEFVGQGEGLAVGDLRQRDFQGLTLCRNLTQEPQGPGLVAAFLLGPGEGEGARGVCAGLLPAVSQAT